MPLPAPVGELTKVLLWSPSFDVIRLCVGSTQIHFQLQWQTRPPSKQLSDLTIISHACGASAAPICDLASGLLANVRSTFEDRVGRWVLMQQCCCNKSLIISQSAWLEQPRKWSLARTTPNYAAIPIVLHDADEIASIENFCKTQSQSQSRFSWCKLMALNGNEIVSYSEHPVSIGVIDGGSVLLLPWFMQHFPQ